MNQTVLEHVQAYNRSQGWPDTEQDCIETIRYAKVVQKDSGDAHRWYTVYNKVVEVNGMFIGFQDYEASGDEGAGVDFDPAWIKQYEPIIETVTNYYPKKG